MTGKSHQDIGGAYPTVRFGLIHGQEFKTDAVVVLIEVPALATEQHLDGAEACHSPAQRCLQPRLVEEIGQRVPAFFAGLGRRCQDLPSVHADEACGHTHVHACGDLVVETTRS